MRILRQIAVVFDWVLAVTVAFVALLWGGASVFGRETFVQRFFAAFGFFDYLGVMFFGVCLLVLNVAIVAELVARMRGLSYLQLDTPGGKVNVSLRAMQDALRRAVQAIEGVGAATIRVTAPSRAGRPVVVRAYLTLSGGEMHRDVSRNIVSAMEMKFNDIVGASIPLECHVYWEKIKDKSKAAVAGRPGEYEVLRPQFPVDEDSQEST